LAVDDVATEQRGNAKDVPEPANRNLPQLKSSATTAAAAPAAAAVTRA